VEEQFYLVWPLAFLFLGSKWRAPVLAVVLAGLIVFTESHRLNVSFAHIAAGALVALSDGLKRQIERLATAPVIAGAAALVLVQPVFFDHPLPYAVIGALLPVLLTVVFFGSLAGRGPFAPALSTAWLTQIGVVSYSVYLWQQLWTAQPEFLGQVSMLYVPFLLVVPALLSYRYIERPMIAVGHRLSERILGQAGKAVAAE
jgi:peptidoglycan/LPS O-acetylase OafA/YrhL